MIGRDLFAEERRFLKCDCRDGGVIGQVVLLPHCLVLDERAICLEQARVVTLPYMSIAIALST